MTPGWLEGGNGKREKVAFLRWERWDLVNRNVCHKGEEGGKENPGFKEYVKIQGKEVSLSLCPYISGEPLGM